MLRRWVFELRGDFCQNSGMDRSIIQLQEALAYQDEEITRLSEELYIQQKEIRELRHQVARLELELRKVVADAGSIMRDPEHETPPPHY